MSPELIQRFRSSAVRVAILTGLLGVAAIAAPAAPVLAKDFDLVGIIDCGVRSGQKCPSNAQLAIRVDNGGGFERYLIDISWIKGAPGLEQDDLMCAEVSDAGRTDGTLQVLRLLVNCDESGTFNAGVNRAEQPKPKNVDEIPLTGFNLITTLTESGSDPLPRLGINTYRGTIKYEIIGGDQPLVLNNVSALIGITRQPGTFASIFTTGPTASQAGVNCTVAVNEFDRALFRCTGLNIPAGGSVTLTLQVQGVNPGLVTIRVIGDDNNAFKETNELDNEAAENLTILNTFSAPTGAPSGASSDSDTEPEGDDERPRILADSAPE